MKKRQRNGEVRVIIGSGYLAGDLDLRDAGPIPESAGIQIVTGETRRSRKTRTKRSSKVARKKPA